MSDLRYPSLYQINTRVWHTEVRLPYEKPENCKQALERKPDDIKVVIQFSEI